MPLGRENPGTLSCLPFQCRLSEGAFAIEPHSYQLGSISPENGNRAAYPSIYFPCQVYWQTDWSADISTLLADLSGQRKAMARQVSAEGLSLMVAAAHPFESWEDQGFIVIDGEQVHPPATSD